MKPTIDIPPNQLSDNILSSCPAVLANDPAYLANDSRACAGSGISLSGKTKLTIKPFKPSVR